MSHPPYTAPRKTLGAVLFMHEKTKRRTKSVRFRTPADMHLTLIKFTSSLCHITMTFSI